MESKTPDKKEQNPEHHAALHHPAAHPHHEAQSHLNPKAYPEHHEAAQAQHHPRKAVFAHYLHSFRELKSFKALMLMVFDVGFFAAFILSLYLYGYLLGMISEPFKGMDITKLAQQNVQQLSIYQTSLTNVLVFMFLLSIAFALIFVAIWSLSRGLIWTRLLDKKYGFRYFWKSCFLNLIWIALWAIVFLVVFMIFYNAAAENIAVSFGFMIVSFLLALVTIYFTYFLYYTFTHELRIFSSIKDAFKNGVLRFPKLVLPVALALGTFIVVWFVGYLLNFLSYIPYAGSVLKEVLAYVLFLGFAAWVKIYSAGVIKSADVDKR